MRSRKVIIIITVIIFIIVIFLMLGRNSIQLVSSKARNQEKALSTPAPSPRPKTFQFDGSTDLEAELEKVDPQVGTEDFGVIQ